MLDVDNLSTGPIWKLPDFVLPLAHELQTTVTYRPSNVRCRMCS